MLDLIVLGIVPGTNFTFTLWWVLFIAFILSLVVLLYVEAPRFRHHRESHEAMQMQLDV